MSSLRNIMAAAKAISADIDRELGPPEEGLVPTSQLVIMRSLTRDTRSYITSIAHQINGAYENGWYDACAVMIRRLIETLIIETFEKHGVAGNIKGATGDYMFLRDLIAATLTETAWSPSRNLKAALPKLKDVGDKSAHNRFFVAKHGDIQPLIGEIRTVVQELLFSKRAEAIEGIGNSACTTSVGISDPSQAVGDPNEYLCARYRIPVRRSGSMPA